MPGHTFSGDHGPVAVMQNGRQIAGAVKGTVSGSGRAELDSIYKASLPSVIVHGEGKQDGTPTPDNPIDPVFLEGASVVGRGRNLWDKDRYPLKKGIYVNQNNGTTPANSAFAATIDFVPIDFKGIINLNHVPAGYQPGMAFYADDNYRTYISGGKGNSIEIPKGARFMRFTVDAKYADGTDIQIELGSTPTPYTPYIDLGTAPLPILRALPDGPVRDEMDVVSGRNPRNVGHMLLNGKPEEEWFYEDFQGGRFRLAGVEDLKSIPGRNALLSNRFSTLNPINTFGYCFYSLRDMYFYRPPNVSTVEAWRDYLKKYPTDVWYPLADPIIEHYDPAVLRQHPGYTQLIQQGGELPAVIDCEYYSEVKMDSPKDPVLHWNKPDPMFEWNKPTGIHWKEE